MSLLRTHTPVKVVAMGTYHRRCVWGGAEGRWSLPSAGWRNVRSSYPSPRRSHGVLTEAEDFHGSLYPKTGA